MTFGTVISLDLGGFNLMSRRIDPALFKLTSLRNLSLAFNDFGKAQLPGYGFECLTDIIHLNLSDANLFGRIPIGVARLRNLVSLDFSYNDELYFHEPSFHTTMANMSNLKELYLDRVGLSSSGSNWSTDLAYSAPQLQILSLSGCGISGPIHPSFASLRSLSVINFGYNWGLTGKVPQYLSEMSSLSFLDISGNYFEGQFPTKILQLKGLKTLLLSDNPELCVRLTDFLDENNLETLDLGWTNVSYDTRSSFANLKFLKSLGLRTMGTAEELYALITKLPSLVELQLYGSEFEKPVLSWVSNLKQLRDLKLVYYDFSGSVPSWIGNLTRLEALRMWNCNCSVPIPYQIGNLENLTELELMGDDFYGQKIPSWIGNLTKLKSLEINGCNFSGPIPSTIGNLTHLEGMQIIYNKLNGKIPTSLFTLPVLQFIDIQEQISGCLPEISAPSSSPLTFILLGGGSQLTGPIPKSFFQLKHIQYLSLESNNLTGRIDLGSIWRLKNLTFLDLSNNMISLVDREDNITFSSLPNINYLYLESCNLTKLPAALKYLNAVLEIDLSHNQINGAIPNWIWENWKDHLYSLDLSHNMFTTLDKSPPLVHMTYLTFLDLSFNSLQGSIPIPITTSKYVVMDYSNNNFSSIVPNFGRYLRNVIYINLSKNKLSGRMLLSLCHLNKLEILDLSYNNFSGPVPSCLIEKRNLISLKLSANKLRGVLPQSFREGCKLQTIDMNGNQIEGTLPRSLLNCQDLELLDVGDNQIIGSFPSWMYTLPNLRVLILRSNQFDGTINDLHGGHASTKHFPSLQILDLASNHFSGELHSEWFENLKSMNSNNDEGQILQHSTNISRMWTYQDTVTITYKYSSFFLSKILTNFKVIDFSNNSFNGPIPESIGRLVSLHGLNMSHNNFIGQIPSQLGGLTRLESMDLSWNHLSGEIPQELTSLTSLAWLNLSYNNLTGRIPQGNQFLSFPDSSFEGNAGLCGSQASKQCDNPGSTVARTLDHPDPNSLWQDRLDLILVYAFVGLGFGVGFAMAIMFQHFYSVDVWTCKRR